MTPSDAQHAAESVKNAAESAPTPDARPPCRILVTGDVVIDHNLYAGNRPTPDADLGRGSDIELSIGGAGLTLRILEEAVAASPAPSGRSKPTIDFGLKINKRANLPPFLRAYAVWKPFPHEDKTQRWRVAEALGYGPREESKLDDKKSPTDEALAKKAQRGLPYNFAHLRREFESDHDIIVLDDAALGFRFHIGETPWPKEFPPFDQDQATAPPQPNWVILKMLSPVCEGDLWPHLIKHYAERLIAIVTVNDLRREEAHISQNISWEQTATDLMGALTNTPSLERLLRCRHLIVSLREAGVLWVENPDAGMYPQTESIQALKANLKWRLIYHPGNMEGEFADRIPGRVFGCTSCLAAAIGARLGLDGCTSGPENAGQTEEALEIAIKAGLAAMQALETEGHGLVDDKETPGFPLKALGDAMAAGTREHHKIDLPATQGMTPADRRNWRILTRLDGANEALDTPMYGLARRAVLFGLEELLRAPHLEVGKYLTVDRGEIEALRGLTRLVKQYEEDKKDTKPLSIAVFGPPGAGKSFAVKQMAKAILPDTPEPLEFNLSQFSDPHALIGAFHQVRDQALKGKIPLVFWDEFDTENLKWLKSFLAPMHDGCFLEDQVTHPIGKSIFVFAGGTASTMDAFEIPEPPEEEIRKDPELGVKYKHFKASKGPDFVSRLSGHLNVAGPNPRSAETQACGGAHTDMCFPVRRALMLRAHLGAGQYKPIDIDRGLLTAFLEVRKYSHGARSIQKILKTLSNQQGKPITRSHLPPVEVLDMHVDVHDFAALTERDVKARKELTKLASAVHQNYRDTTPAGDIPAESNKPFDELPDHLKQSNVAAADRMSFLLELVGLVLAPKGGTDARRARKDVGRILESHIEMLAEIEHNEWMKGKRASGFRHGPRRGVLRLHPSLVPYDQLGEADKEKDRNNVRQIPSIVEKAGLIIVSPRAPGAPQTP